MPEESGGEAGAAEQEKELREHERKVAERDPHEMDAETARSEGDMPDGEGAGAAAPPNAQGTISQ